jgi:hypothetical protein
MSSRSTSPSAEAWSATSATSVSRNRSACTAGSVVHASRNLCAGRQFKSSDKARTWQGPASLLTPDAERAASYDLFTRGSVNNEMFLAGCKAKGT